MLIRGKLIITVLVLFTLSTWGQAPAVNKKAGKPEVHFEADMDLTVVTCTGEPELIYTPRPQHSVEEIGQKEHFRYLINSAYFAGTRLLAKPAGWLRLDGKIVRKISRSRQLTHIVRYDSAENKMTFLPVKNFKTDPEAAFEFQTGPLVIDNNTIANEFIRQSINGRGKYTRTMLGICPRHNKFYLFTFRNPVSLKEAAEKILSLPLAKKTKLSVINLDGGASVAFYSKELPNYNYNTEDRLPFLLGIK